MEQLHKKLEFVDYLLGAHTTPLFFFSNWVREAETVWLKNVEQS